MGAASEPKRFELLNFVPLVLWAGFVAGMATDFFSSPAIRIPYGVVFIGSFYVISIYIVFRKRLSKWLILLILFPATAFFVYLIILFLKPREPAGTAGPSATT